METREESSNGSASVGKAVPGQLELILNKFKRRPSYSWGKPVRRPGEYWDSHSDSLTVRVAFPRRRLPQIFFTCVLAFTAAFLAMILIGVTNPHRIKADTESEDVNPFARIPDEERPYLEKLPRELNDEHLLFQLTMNQLDETRVLESIKVARSRRITDLDLALLPQLAHRSYAVRLETLKVLIASKKSIYMDSYVAHLIDRDPLVRELAVQGIAELGDSQTLRKWIGSLDT